MSEQNKNAINHGGAMPKRNLDLPRSPAEMSTTFLPGALPGNLTYEYDAVGTPPLRHSAIAQSFSPVFDSRFLESESRI